MNQQNKTQNAPSFGQEGQLRSLQEQFFKNLKNKGRSTNTLKNYRTDLECFNQFLYQKQNHLNLTHFKLEQVEQYGNYLQQRYQSDNSRRRRLQTLRVFFDFLVESDVFNNNPVRKVPTSPKFLDKPRPTSFVDIKTLWSYLLEEENCDQPMSRLSFKRNQLIVLLIFGAGLKVSDISGLIVKQIFIPDNKPENKDELPRVMVSPPKRDPYTIPLPLIFKTIYQEYITELEEMKKKSSMEFDQLLFNANPYSILSGGLSVRGTEIIFEEFRKKLMISITPKSLRQSCIFKWLQQGHDELLIKEWMGVAPSYSLKLYKDHLSQHVFSDEFLMELYNHYQKKNLRLRR